MFDLNLKVCNYPQTTEACSFLYTGDASDDGSYNENELIGSSEDNESSRLINDDDSSSANNENNSELEAAQPPERSNPERSSPVTSAPASAALSDNGPVAPLEEEDDSSSW